MNYWVPKGFNLYSFIREEEVARLVHRVAESYPSTTNLTKLLGIYANDVICRVAFGRDFSAAGEYDRHGFQKMLEEFHVLLGGISIGDFFPSMEFIHSLTGMKSRLQNVFQRFDKLFDQLLTEHQIPKEKKRSIRILLIFYLIYRRMTLMKCHSPQIILKLSSWSVCTFCFTSLIAIKSQLRICCWVQTPRKFLSNARTSKFSPSFLQLPTHNMTSCHWNNTIFTWVQYKSLLSAPITYKYITQSCENHFVLRVIVKFLHADYTD